MRIWWPVKVWVVRGNVHTLWCRALSPPVFVAGTVTSDAVHHFISLWQSNISLV
jgi:hypothetical protein